MYSSSDLSSHAFDHFARYPMNDTTLTGAFNNGLCGSSPCGKIADEHRNTSFADVCVCARRKSLFFQGAENTHAYLVCGKDNRFILN